MPQYPDCIVEHEKVIIHLTLLSLLIQILRLGPSVRGSSFPSPQVSVNYGAVEIDRAGLRLCCLHCETPENTGANETE